MDKQSLLRHALRRASSRPAFVAYVLVQFQEVNELSESELASCLEMMPENLPKLGFCFRPSNEQQVQQVAVYAGCNAERLARVLRL